MPVDAHMPPNSVPAPADTVWEDLDYDADTNEWSPSNTPHSVWGVAEPPHTDDPTAQPISESYDVVSEDTEGSVPDARANLLTDVRYRGSAPPPVQRVEHVVTTEELAPSLIRARLVAVVGNTTPTVLVEENVKRRRALFQVVTAASTVLIFPARQGGVPQLTAAPTLPLSAWVLSTSDGRHESKSGAAVEAVGISAAGVVLVNVWEEIDGPGNMPGLT